MKLDEADIAKKWYPYSLYVFYLTVLASTSQLAVVYGSRCEALVIEDDIPLCLTIMLMSGGIALTFYYRSRANYKDPTHPAFLAPFIDKREMSYLPFAWIIYCMVSLIFPALAVFRLIGAIHLCL